MVAVEGVPGRKPRSGIAFVFVVLIVAALSGLLLAPTVAGRLGGPDICGYTWTNSNNPDPKVPFGWIEIKDNGTLITSSDWIGGGDDGFFNVGLGFNFTFYDFTYLDAFIGTNGYISFGQGYTDYDLPGIPDPLTPNNALYGFGEDLLPDAAASPGGVYYRALASPNRFVVEYLDVPHYGTPPSSPVTFEVVIHERGDVWYEYLSLTGGAPQVVGIENADGTAALAYGFAPSNMLAIRFSPPSTAPASVGVDLAPCAQRVTAVPGLQADAPLRVTNNGTGSSDTIDMTFSSPSGWTGSFYHADGVTPLTDTDGDGIPDTDSLPSGGFVDVLLRVDVPPAATGTEIVSITGTSSVDAGVSDISFAHFTVPPAALAPPYYDYGLDTNGNGQFDYLILDVNLTVTVADSYYLQAELHDPTYTLDIFNATTVFLGVGSATVVFSYSGPRINGSGIDGPYIVNLYLFRTSDFAQLDSGTHFTQPYSHLQFESPPAAFAPPHFDYGLDTNGNGQFDYIILDVNLTVTVADSYNVQAALHDPSYALFIFNSTTAFLGVGSATLVLGYDGRAINASGIDGPYTVDLYLYRASDFTLLGTGTHFTQPYSHLQFETPPANLAPPHSDAGVDTDGDGRYNFLNVSVNITVNSADTYYVSGFLYDTSGTLSLSASAVGYLLPGSAMLNLSFGGVRINESGQDGPYFVDLYLSDIGSVSLFLGYNQHVTQAYRHTEFEEIPTIFAALATTTPTIDGAISSLEWGDATVVDLATISGNNLQALLYVKSDYTTLYVAYDATGDTSLDASDTASISFDTGNDGAATNGHEDEFAQGGFAPNNQAHYVYDSSSFGWTVQDSPYDPSLPNETGLASASGFGASPNSGVNHRRYEFAIPLALLGAKPGDILGFFGGSQPSPGVVDGSTFAYSLWPEFAFGPLPLYAYGDLVLAPDSTPPSISITAPPSGTLSVVNSLDVTWTAYDLGLGLDHFTVAVDGAGPVSLSASATSYAVSGLLDGDHTVVVTAWDEAGNSANDSVTFTVDTTAPAVAISSPAPNAILASGTVTLTWTASDATSGVDHFDISLDGGSPTARPATATSFTFNGLADGPHTANVTGYDRAGHWTTVTRDFTVDTVAPAVALTAPSPGYVTTGSVIVAWSASDAGAGLARIEVSLDGGTPIVLPGSATTHTLTGVSDGDHTISVRAVDYAGNSASDSVSVTVDQTPPTASLSSPVSGAILTANQIALTWSAFDAISGLERIEVSLDGGTPVVLPTTASTYTFASVADGSHTVRLAAFDNAGNSLSVSSTVTVDTTAPTASITAPSPSATLASSSVAVTWTASDATAGIDHFEIALDGAAQTIPATVTSYTFTGVSDGTHTIRVTAVDRAGHSTDATVTLTVDTTDPSLSITAPVEGAVVTSSSPTVQWTTGDATSGVDHVTLSVDGGTAQTLSASATSQALSGLSDGAHSVTITVIDRAGNSATTTVSFRVDTGFFSPSGPYGSSGLIAIILLIVVVLVATIFLIRRRRGARPPQGET